MKNFFLSTVFWLGVLSLSGLVYAHKLEQQHTQASLTETQIADAINAKLPLTQRYGTFDYAVEQKVDVTFMPDGHVKIIVPFRIDAVYERSRAYFGPYFGAFYALSKLTWRDGGLYLTPLKYAHVEGKFDNPERDKVFDGVFKGAAYYRLRAWASLRIPRILQLESIPLYQPEQSYVLKANLVTHKMAGNTSDLVLAKHLSVTLWRTCFVLMLFAGVLLLAAIIGGPAYVLGLATFGAIGTA